jgi:hypothetical protein
MGKRLDSVTVKGIIAGSDTKRYAGGQLTCEILINSGGNVAVRGCTAE